MNAETTRERKNATAGDVPDLSREGNNGTGAHEPVTCLTADMLPALTDRFVEKARSEPMVNWSRGIFGAYAPGMMHMDGDQGFALQVIHPNTIRVIQVFDGVSCFSALSFVVESMKEAGIDVEIDGHAVITPIPASSPSSEVESSSGRADASSEDALGLSENALDVGGDLGTTAAIRNAECDIGMWS